MSKKDSKRKSKDSDNKKESFSGDLQNQFNELKHGWQRTQADFENARKRWDEERKNIAEAVKLATLLEFSPVLDNFERAFANAPEDAAWLEGFKAIKRQIEEVYSSEDLVRVGLVGEDFDPTRHEAMSQIEIKDCKPDTICQVLEYGWEVKGKIFKPAKVVVAK